VNHLTEKDLRKLADSLGELYRGCGLDRFGKRALAVLPGLIGCDACSYNEVNPARRQVVAQTAPDAFAFPGMVEAFHDYMAQHPLFGHYRATRDEHAVKITDLLSLREFRQLPVYRDFYRLVGVDRQLAIVAPARPGVMIGVAVSRSGRDFTERDRAALEFLRPHLMRAYANAAALSAAGLDVRALSEAVAGGCDAAAVIAADGRISYISDRARDLLSRYGEPAEPGGLLPSSLRPWRAAALARTHPACPAPAVLGSRRITRGASCLTLTLLSADPHGSVLLALAEHPAAAGGRARRPGDDLRARGLTQREAEVLSLAAGGRTNREIACLLGISPLTVRKHLENAYPKLGVGNRTAAAAMLR
jgi:DNA-binding CsgD family transcriptional regulator